MLTRTKLQELIVGTPFLQTAGIHLVICSMVAISSAQAGFLDCFKAKLISPVEVTGNDILVHDGPKTISMNAMHAQGFIDDSVMAMLRKKPELAPNWSLLGYLHGFIWDVNPTAGAVAHGQGKTLLGPSVALTAIDNGKEKLLVIDIVHKSPAQMNFIRDAVRSQSNQLKVHNPTFKVGIQDGTSTDALGRQWKFTRLHLFDESGAKDNSELFHQLMTDVLGSPLFD
jgi:hypothetical protein